MNQQWTVTTTTMSEDRRWGVRCEWLGMGYVLAIQVNKSPAMRIIICGWSLYVGKLLGKPKTIRYDLGEIAALKGGRTLLPSDAT